jgi:MtrB/PioB family decaheme-associated outer membrane protein
MKALNKKLTLTAVMVAVGQLSFPMLVRADDDEAQALKTPQNTVEVGSTNVNSGGGGAAGLARFGEYNGLSKGGGYPNLNIHAKGGTAFTQNEQGETMRWSVDGDNLGLTNRNLNMRLSDQGEWSVGLSIDELQHWTAPGYQTPYSGTMGGNRFTTSMPTLTSTNASVFNPAYSQSQSFTTPVTPTPNTSWSTYLQSMDVYTDRTTSTITASRLLSGQSSIDFEFSQLRQSGAKLMSMPTAKNGTVPNEKIAYLPNPTQYETDQWNLGYHWKGEKSRYSLSYVGSAFRNANDAVYFQPAFSTTATPGATQALSTAPSNTFNQINANAGYDISKQTKLTGNFSWGMGLQNQGFNPSTYSSLYAGSGAYAGPTSLNGRVDNTHFDIRLTDQYSSNLTLSGVLRYDERLNKTASNAYHFYGIDYSSSHVYNYYNTPFSNRKNQAELAADYKFNPDQKLRVTVGHESYSRWCENYGTAANCVVATGHGEDKMDATFRQKLNAETDLRVGYAYSDRKTTTNTAAITDMISINGNILVGAGGYPSGVTATNAITGLNGGDYQGFNPYFSASRRQDALKMGATTQINDQWALGLSGKWGYDRYGDSTFGVQNGSSQSLNADLSYAYKENANVYGYITGQRMQRDMTNKYVLIATSPSTSGPINQELSWMNRLQGRDVTLGLGFNDESLMGSRLTLKGDANFSFARTGYFTQLNYSPSLSCTDPTVLSCGSVPDIRYSVVQLKLIGEYRLEKNTKVTVTYLNQHMWAQDYYYNGLQTGYTPTSLIPTNQSPGAYKIQLFGVSYVHGF